MGPITNMVETMAPLRPCLTTLDKTIQVQTFHCALLLTNSPSLPHALTSALTFKIRIESHWAYIVGGTHFLLSHFFLLPS